MNKSLNSVIFLFIFMLLAAACAEKIAVVNSQIPINELSPPQESARRSLVLDSIHGQIWRWYYGKYSVNYLDKDRKLSVKLSLKCAKDSATNALISFAGIPFVNSLITEAKIVYLNKKDRCFGEAPLSSLKNLLGIELTLENLQELFLGLPLAFSNTSSLQQQAGLHSDTLIYVQKDRTLTARYSYAKKTNRIVEQRMELSDGRRMTVTYLSWNDGLISTPASIVVSIIENGNESIVKMTADRYELNLPQDIAIEIPPDYEKCP